MSETESCRKCGAETTSGTGYCWNCWDKIEEEHEKEREARATAQWTYPKDEE